MPTFADPRSHQFDPRHGQRSGSGCFACWRPKDEHPVPVFVAQPGGRQRVYWKGAFIGEVRPSFGAGRKTWTFIRPGDTTLAGFWLPSRREAVDWLLMSR
jgi:hypothetical protein